MENVERRKRRDEVADFRSAKQRTGCSRKTWWIVLVIVGIIVVTCGKMWYDVFDTSQGAWHCISQGKIF